MPTIQEIIQEIEGFAPLAYQESYDNAGLLVGDKSKKINQVLICLDCTEAVLDEAIQKKCGLIIAHHPIIFGGLRSLTGKNYIERIVIKAIKHGIAIYAAHTNLDNISSGVNAKIAEKLGLSHTQILDPKPSLLKQLYTYVPKANVIQVREALFAAGAGEIGAYSQCSYLLEGNGTFLPNEDANPYIGQKNQLHQEAETKIEVILPAHLEGKVLQALKQSHPYEEIAYGFIQLSNTNPYIGSGIIGTLQAPLKLVDFLKLLKKKMKTNTIKYTNIPNKLVHKVAVCGGSGSFLLPKAIHAGADIFVSGDFKYHQFFDGEDKIVIADIGHYESEQFTGEIFYEILSKKFPSFAIHLTSVNTNPVSYF
ncbi:MAG: Nif3-like dinuclear metal center hexameric protein [Chitinophagaceae bacterium]|jgi:dinuclear metal center YbgI/SA1388 family protein|nr:Nif3-like dinuclear metal center hexameric protein [Chitinophagaceae bacterium]